nr:class I SAM-dependent methyltransferase [Paenibacillus bovis]
MENNVFEQMAKRYDTEDRIELANVIAKEVRSTLQNCETKTLMDYGSGTGLVSLELVDLVQSILLVDSSQQMLEVAEAKITQRGIPNAKVLYSDFTQETPDVKVDIILMSLVLLHIPDTKKILHNLFGMLNNGGKLIIVDFDKNDKIYHPKVHNGFAHEELKETLSQVGFSSMEMKTFYHGENIFMKQDASMFISTSIKKDTESS